MPKMMLVFVNHQRPSAGSRKYSQEETERREWTGADIAIILQCIDEEHEEGRGDEFGEKLSSFTHEFGGVCAENARCGGFRVSGDGSDAGTTFKDIDGAPVVTVDDCRGSHRTEDLGESVDGKLSPGELAVNAIGEGDSWVEMCTRDAGAVDTKHDAETGERLE